jgi:hypothetical protein
MSEIKPCPFCGDTPAVGITFYKSSGSEVLLKAIVYCQRCKISRYKIFKATDGYDGITPFLDYEVAMDTAKKAWNMRVNDDDKI